MLALSEQVRHEQDGMASLIRRAVHLFDLIMGKVVGSNGFLLAFMRTSTMVQCYRSTAQCCHLVRALHASMAN